ncbi:hypothetical protein FA15DRAFT_711189 [Coprinopsis marcescibilis]|uniref:Uncharacterized protein n=1 Tax=Coprinopsis marcescibilis TaxID=230819 RepID=A0A5C3KAM0_COPMA|nr:hypothetical protein FA15DRAFT_711189 [Coprinopsis marcescibilis]
MTVRFCKAVPEALWAQVERQYQEREQWNAAVAARTVNEHWLKHSVFVVLYRELDEELTVHPIQDIPTWPTFNLAEIPNLPGLLEVSDITALQLFEPWLSHWISQLDQAITPFFDQLASMESSSLAWKQILVDSPVPSSLAKRSKLSISVDSFFLSCSLAMASSDPIKISDDDDPGPSSVRAAPLPSPTPTPPPLSFVLTPADPNLAWPAGMYDTTAALLERFPAVFMGIKFKSTTYQKNKKF